MWKPPARKVLVWSAVPALSVVTLLPAVAVAESQRGVSVSSDEGVNITITTKGEAEPVLRCATPPVAAPVKPTRGELPGVPFEGVRPTVDVAILLDTSNSMDGLISQAKSQLWSIVRQFATAEKHGQTPSLRVALFEYGNNGLPASEGYIRQVVPLTDDLDALSAALFELTTDGGSEYCGQVIDEALTQLDWSTEPNGYKAVFIAGNEPFTQGPVDYRDASKRAIELGVVVNTIHCGAYDTGRDGMWHDGARLAEGEYLNIDQDRAVVHIEAPQDKIIIELNAKLNETYLWFGDREERVLYYQNQFAQDANAMGMGGMGMAAERAAVKATSSYSNRGRDLVDSFKADADVLESVADEALPEEFRALDDAERQAKLEALAAERAAIQAEIAALSAEREAFVAAERKRLAEEAGDATLGDAVKAAVVRQLADAGFEVPAETPAP